MRAPALHGDGFIRVARTGHGYAISLNIDKLLERIPKAVGGGTPLRRAYCKYDAGEATSITCYLDEDDGDTEVSVSCEIVGGGYLNSAAPRLEDGDMLWVAWDGEESVYRPLFLFQATEDCECTTPS